MAPGSGRRKLAMDRTEKGTGPVKKTSSVTWSQRWVGGVAGGSRSPERYSATTRCMISASLVFSRHRAYAMWWTGAGAGGVASVGGSIGVLRAMVGSAGTANAVAADLCQ